MSGAAGAGALLGGFFDAWGNQVEYSANNKAAGFNIVAAERNAKLALIRGRELERKQRVMGDQAVGDVVAGYAASGVTLEGSALDVIENSAANAELDAQTIRYESKQQSEAFKQEADMLRSKRKSDKKAYELNQWATAFGAGASAFGKSK